MNVKNAFIFTSLLFGAVLSGTNSAEAASFTSNVTGNDPTKDIILNSITQNGKNINNFSYINKAVIQYNTPRTNDPNSGAASTDRGDNVVTPQLPEETPDNVAIAAYLGNNNLNNIIDTEDVGAFTIDVFFDSQITKDNSGLDSLFFWERGMNSSLGIQALDSSGNVIGNINPTIIHQTRNNYAGFKIDTTEIWEAQEVGSWGINLDLLGVTKLSGLRLTANSSFSGPDFKIIARKTTPEPTTILGLGAVAALCLLRRQWKQGSASASVQ
ncbi:exosortase-dependent surface protein XDP2 [Anabaena catenula]|uniref:PEP-CTERM sorting domain-containing protein n=1 Tax=Anabaena catenula FACHB-362 TaxID=2692877 RepID=A0ABR8J2S5_9NOST|nr:exosortase-dependent surface protein XDP2 [Anabaena catenula]MBD2691812.1 PEP-CTERM sorting domain-containing protein [Anabaena catenula FACHB-362]